MIDKGSSDEGFFWNPINYDCECDKSCVVGEYLDYKNCKYRNKLNNKLVEKCSENIDVNEMIHNNYGKVCNSCIIYNILFIIAFWMIIGISSAFIHFHWYLKKGTILLFLLLILALKQ